MSEYIFKLPDLGEGTVESEIGEWFIKVGDLVNEEDIVGTVMTDKAAVEVSSPVTGKVIRLAGEPGDVVAVGAPLVVFDVAAESAPAEPEKPVDGSSEPKKIEAETAPAEPKHSAERSSDPKESAVEEETSRRIITSPAIRRRAREAGIDLSLVPGTGPGGRIVRKDFDNYLKARATGSIVARPATPSTAVKETKIIGVRRVIAERMQAAKLEIPHFTYVEEVDVTGLEALRRHLNEKRDASERLTLLPFLGLALIRTLREFPQCNVTHDKDRNLLLQH